MRRVIVPAIPYDSSGWKTHGFDRVHGQNWKTHHYDKYDLVVCLGKAYAYPYNGCIVYNESPVGYVTNSLKESTKVFGDLMPPPPEYGDDFWVKTPGYGGVGKTFYQHPNGPDTIPTGAVLQKHVEGVEYRVITVGDMVVQAFRKDKKDDGIVGSFVWFWIGVAGAGNINGLIPTAKAAAQKLSDRVGHSRHIIGWDIIRDSEYRAWLIEGNSAPGCNDKTAGRIWSAIQTIEGV